MGQQRKRRRCSSLPGPHDASADYTHLGDGIWSWGAGDGAGDGAGARDGKWAWPSIEMSELRMAGGEGKGGVKEGGLGD